MYRRDQLDPLDALGDLPARIGSKPRVKGIAKAPSKALGHVRKPRASKAAETKQSPEQRIEANRE